MGPTVTVWGRGPTQLVGEKQKQHQAPKMHVDSSARGRQMCRTVLSAVGKMGVHAQKPSPILSAGDPHSSALCALVSQKVFAGEP